ncbi:MAG: hypothetical protein QM426_02165 [Euryarchaeota archaeon]|nr:hypothetical protein [Euryarchaeota archaeon]
MALERPIENAEKCVEIKQGPGLLLKTAHRSNVDGHEDLIPKTVARCPWV